LTCDLLNDSFISAPERGSLNNTSLYKKTTPTCFRSPFTVQGDLGFIATNNKKYGIFFVGVQTFSRRIFCIPIKNNKGATLIEAIQAMLKVNPVFFTCSLFCFSSSWLTNFRTNIFREQNVCCLMVNQP
jgi:hypothetical protein